MVFKGFHLVLLQFPGQQSVPDGDTLLQFTERPVRKHLEDRKRLRVKGFRDLMEEND